MKKVVSVVVMIMLSICSFAQDAADNVIGVWLNGEGTGQIQIYKTTSGHYAGKTIWLKEPLDEETGKPKLDKHNPDVLKRNLPILGLIILQSFKYNREEKIWEHGKIYDPKNGKDYSGKMELVDPNKIKLRGYIGISLLGRNDTWTRVIKK